jgi:hypothetical protein
MLAIAALALSSFIAVPAPAVTPAKDRPIILTSLTIGSTDPNGKVPTVNGVPDSGTLNWDIALPVAALIVGQDYHVTATFHDLGYSGSCNAQATLSQKQGHKKVTLRSIPLGPAHCDSGLVYLLHGDMGATPDAAGPATLTVDLYFGDSKESLKVPMVITAP